MRQVMKKILLAGAVMLGLLQSAQAFSLGGPIGNGGDAWQVPAIGYGLAGDLNAPKNIGEEFRRNTPVMYYAFDPNFLGFFGSNGVAAVDQAFGIMNSLTNVSSYSANLSEFPLDSREVNYEAQALAVWDLKSVTLGALMEQMGLADPVRYAWTLHDRYHVGSVACPVGMEYMVVQRNFDTISSPLNQLQYSPYVNDTLYTYQILEACTGNPLAIASPYSTDPLADTYSPVTSRFVGNGDYVTGLTRDDVAGLRYLLRTNNINWETPASGSQLFVTTTNFSTQQLFPNGNGTNSTGTNAGSFYYYDGTYGYGDLRGLLTTAQTNSPAVLQALYPGLVISSSSNYFVLASNATVTSYYTNGGNGSPYGTVVLVTVTNYTRYLQERFNYQFANIVTNHYYKKSATYLQSVTVGPLTGSPYPPVLTTNTTSTTVVTTNIPSGDFFLFPQFQTNLCPLNILYTGLTNVIATTNLISSTSTNVVATNATVTSYSYYQYSITYFTNYIYVINPVTCALSTNSTGLYQGIENIKFLKSSYDSLIGQYFQPITNNYTMVYVVNSQPSVRHFQRVVTAPDFLFSAADQANGPAAIPGLFSYFRNLNFDTANVLPGLAGPGTINPATTITFDKVGPVFYNSYADVMTGTPYFTSTPGGDITDLYYALYFVWGSYDGTTNAPVVYPNGTSLDSLENQILIQVSPTTVPDGSVGWPYTPTTFTATGGSFIPPFTWSATGLPDGLSVALDGTLAGTPILAGTNIFTLTLTDSLSRSVQWRYTINITPF